jgi:uncharacterized protein
LVQTVLVQDEALKRAEARIRELTGEDAGKPASGGFLDSMRQALTGRSTATSMPSVRPGTSAQPDPRWNSGGTLATAAPSPGGSFLGTAAASAAGMIGGALLLNSISSMFDHHGGNAFAAVPPAGSPWDNSAAGSDLSREAASMISDVARAATRSPPGFSTMTTLQTCPISAAITAETSAAATAPELAYNTTTLVPTFTRS